MRLALAFLLLSITILAAVRSGSSDEPAPRARIVRRIIDEAPTEIFDPTSWIRRSPTFTWHFDDAEEWARWTPQAGPTTPGPAGSLALASWVRLVSLDTAAIDAIELSVSRPPAEMRFILSWATQGQLFAPERILEGRLLRPVRGSRGQVHFDLRSHPHWQGTINRLRLRVRSPETSEPPERLLRQLTGIEVTAPTSDPLIASYDRFWKIDLDGDVRNAMMIPAGSWRAFNLDVPSRATLRFAFGSRTVLERSVTVRVEAFSGGNTTTLFSGLVDAGPTDWQPVGIDLARLAGRRVRIRFRALQPPEPAVVQRTEGGSLKDGQLENGSPVIAWAHPEILQSGPFEKPDAVPPHVVLVSIDTLRADHLSLYGYSRSTSPYLDAWAARRASVFLHAVAQAPWTLPSHVSMLSGQNAQHHGVNHDGAIPASVEMLAQRLRRAGYTTIAITGGGFLHPRHGFARGFDRYVFWRHGRDGDRDELAVGIERALEAIGQNRGEPLFLFFHTYETHAPYLPREPYFTAFGGSPGTPAMRIANVAPVAEDGFIGRNELLVLGAESERPERLPTDSLPHLSRLYDSGVAHTDAMVHRLLERVESLAVQVPSMVIVTSDHGEDLGDGDRFGHTALYDDTLLVPLVIRTPSGAGAGRRIAQQVRSIDIVPTVLELAGLPPATNIDGYSLAGLLAGRSAPPHPSFKQAWSYSSNPNRGLSLRHDGRLKYVWNTTAWAAVANRERYYDLRRDPGERTNLADDIDIDTATLRAIALKTLATAPGLRVRIARPASTAGALIGELRGPAINPLRVEQVGTPCDCVQWLSNERARFSLVPGGQLDLLIEEVESRTLTFTLPSRWGHTFKTTLTLDHLATPHTLSRRSKGEWTWHEAPLKRKFHARFRP